MVSLPMFELSFALCVFSLFSADVLAKRTVTIVSEKLDAPNLPIGRQRANVAQGSGQLSPRSPVSPTVYYDATSGRSGASSGATGFGMQPQPVATQRRQARQPDAASRILGMISCLPGFGPCACLPCMGRDPPRKRERGPPQPQTADAQTPRGGRTPRGARTPEGAWATPMGNTPRVSFGTIPPTNFDGVWTLQTAEFFDAGRRPTSQWNWISASLPESKNTFTNRGAAFAAGKLIHVTQALRQDATRIFMYQKYELGSYAQKAKENGFDPLGRFEYSLEDQHVNTRLFEEFPLPKSGGNVDYIPPSIDEKEIPTSDNLDRSQGNPLESTFRRWIDAADATARGCIRCDRASGSILVMDEINRQEGLQGLVFRYMLGAQMVSESHSTTEGSAGKGWNAIKYFNRVS